MERQALDHDGPLGNLRRPFEERHGAQHRVVALPGARAVRRPAVEDEIGVDDADAARMNVAARRLADERECRPPEQLRLGEHRVDAVLAVGALLAVVEHAHDRSAGAGALLEHGQDRRVAALHVGRAPPDHARALEPRLVPLPRRHRVEVPDEGDRIADVAHARDERVAEALHRHAGQGTAARLDEVGERRLLAGHAGDGDELEREPREGLGVGRQAISSSRRSALRSGPSAPASSMTSGILRAQVSCLRAY